MTYIYSSITLPDSAHIYSSFVMLQVDFPMQGNWTGLHRGM